MSLTLRFWGTRGSIPSPGPSTVRFGGNTPCLEVRTASGALVILDAGTGIRELGRSLMDDARGGPIEGDIFLSHAHWDHIQGIPFFAPLFAKENRFTIWISPLLGHGISRVIREQMSPTVFPVSFDELEAHVAFRELAGNALTGDGFAISAMSVRHPGGALAYRLSDGSPGGPSLVYVSDNELNPAARYDDPPAWRQEFVDFIRGSAVLVHDTMYTSAEYESFVGWGHSTYVDAVELGLEAGVKQLVLFHHRPERSDDEIDRCLESCRTLAASRGSRMEIVAAAEGMSLTL